MGGSAVAALVRSALKVRRCARSVHPRGSHSGGTSEGAIFRRDPVLPYLDVDQRKQELDTLSAREQF